MINVGQLSKNRMRELAVFEVRQNSFLYFEVI